MPARSPVASAPDGCPAHTVLKDLRHGLRLGRSAPAGKLRRPQSRPRLDAGRRAAGRLAANRTGRHSSQTLRRCLRGRRWAPAPAGPWSEGRHEGSGGPSTGPPLPGRLVRCPGRPPFGHCGSRKGGRARRTRCGRLHRGRRSGRQEPPG